MEKVTVVKPAVNQWINFLKMNRNEQNEFLEELIIQGKISRSSKGGYLVFSEEEYGTIFNPALIDRKIVYFVFEKDAIDFIKAFREKINENFLHYRLCNGGCNH
ncbi:MAG: hypothetical protein WA092_01840 [Minisyncoccales bacterium]